MATLETSLEANYDGQVDRRTDRRTKRLIGARATALPKNGCIQINKCILIPQVYPGRNNYMEPGNYSSLIYLLGQDIFVVNKDYLFS